MADHSTLLPSSSGSLSASRSLALASRVSGVLSTSFSDTEVRDALALLDDRDIQNTGESRRNLRSDAQKDVIQSNGAIIKEFGLVAQQLTQIGASIKRLNEGFLEMRKHIDIAHVETRPVLDEAADLTLQKNQVQSKQELLRAFRAHFVMSEDELATLTNSNSPVDKKFFMLLARAKQIQADCEILLGFENQRLGLELMSTTTKTVNAAFQKLHKWVHREFKQLNFENPHISPSIRIALGVLAERPSLFQSCLDAFADSREHILSDSFYTALTGRHMDGQDNRTVKPIELVAHDPLRYIGDMLAWTHSATVGEREALEALFTSDDNEIARGIKIGRDNEPWNRYDEQSQPNSFDGLKALQELVDRDVAGVSQVLRERVAQVIQSHDDTLLAYKITNLLEFYRATFSRMVGQESALLNTLAELEASAWRQFRGLLKDQVLSVQGEQQQIATNLCPPDFLLDALTQLTSIMTTYEKSFSTADSREDEFAPILEDALEPYLQNAKALGEGFPDPGKRVYDLNCLLVSKACLLQFDFVLTRLSKLEDLIHEQVFQLIEYQYKFLLENSGLSRLTQALNYSPAVAEDVSLIPTLDVFRPAALAEISQILDAFLPSALADTLENLTYLQSVPLAREITEEAAERFCEDFELIEEKIVAADSVLDHHQDDDLDIVELRTLFPRTSGEIRVLLS